MAPTSTRSWLPWPFARNRPPFVPVLRLSGVIGGGGALRGAGLSLAGIERAIETAFGYRHAPAVALAINSPGGSPTQSELIALRIRRAADERKKPVIAFVEDVGASGGYWLACSADEIFAAECSVVGSIGVISAGFGFSTVLDRLGIERRVHTAGERKAMLDPFRPEDPLDVARLRVIQDAIHQAFKKVVLERRKGRLHLPEDELFSGQIWSGHAALEGGLIDGIGDLHGLLRERFGPKLRTRVVNASRSWWWQRRLLPGAARAADPGALADVVLERLEERALYARYGL
jgi:serine protease SohB